MSYHRIGKNGGKYKGKKGAGILFTDGKQILLLKRAKGSDNPYTWGIPGGGAKEGESAIDNAKRETSEECALDCIPGQRVEDLECGDGGHHWTTFLYVVPKPFDVGLSEEHVESKWINLCELKDFDLHPKFKNALPRYLNCIRRKFGTQTFEEWIVYRKINENRVEKP